MYGPGSSSRSKDKGSHVPVEITFHPLLDAQALDLAIEPARDDGDIRAVVVGRDEGRLADDAAGLVDGGCTCVASVEDHGSAGVDRLEDGCSWQCGGEGAQKSGDGE